MTLIAESIADPSASSLLVVVVVLLQQIDSERNGIQKKTIRGLTQEKERSAD
jgi:hypothetical protein